MTLQGALDYAKRGWFVFPCRGKRPLTQNGFKDATTDEKTIIEWWRQWPDANVAIATGASGLVVIDVDVKNENGLESWHDVCQDFGISVDTATVETPSGGLHFYFSANGRKIRSSAGKIAPGVDVRAQGGYVIAPPSKTESGEYAWAFGADPDTVGVAPLPSVLAEIIGDERRERREGDEATGIIPEGARNATLASLAGTMRARGFSRTAIEAALLAQNRERCVPPLPDEEVLRIARSIARYPSGTAGEVSAERELGHANVLRRLWANKYRYAAHRGRWMMWDTRRWVEITDEQAAARAAEDLRDAYIEALASAPSGEAAERIEKALRDACSFWRINGTLGFLQGFDEFHTSVDAWDSNPWLLNVLNGVIDLKTVRLLPHDPKYLCTKIAPVVYDANATAPSWEEHLEFFLPDPEVRHQVQRDLGMALVGTPLEERLVVWYGTGANGKSTTARVIMELLGDYAGMAAPNLLVVRQNDEHPTEVADLLGRRLVFASEISGAARLNEAKVKQLTGGDRQKARYMHKDFFEFEQTWDIFLLCNHKPIVHGSDEGIWRRLRIVPWTVRIPREKMRPQSEVLNTLLSEGSGILNWLLAGLAAWRQDPDWVADQVTEATTEYRFDQDRIGEFLRACCVEDDGAVTTARELYEAYTWWCEENGETPMSQTAFGRNMADRGYQRSLYGPRRVSAYHGLRLVRGGPRLASHEDDSDDDVITRYLREIDDLYE